MTKTEQIQDAIERATRRESKLTPFALSVPMLGSLQIRHLLNNLGAISERFLDVGSHVGGSFCSAVFHNGNLLSASAVDSWESDSTNGDTYEKQFLENVEIFASNTSTLKTIVKAHCFTDEMDHLPVGIDLFSYDAGHSREDQKNALIYYRPILADEFIYVCDDWTYGDVALGTMEGIKEGGYSVLFQEELLNDTPGDGHLNEEWWRGYGVFLLKKKP